ncbi:hypothetical protein J2046_005831 [Rhizobium petrolearium]|uniref:hypothetical protein n=1 Tax=Neorhizobium petrolearium TaxID=515361 RepID=UPI001AE3A9F4|nr:hypothetical protein [Neorhizobium petrolearium]MBP1847547.1 hypothetical protein [Neorhizobium petrolearium]
MTRSPERQALLFRMEEARRQTQRQLDMIDRQITAKMTALIPSLGRRRSGYRRGKPPVPEAFLARYRSSLAAITAERQPEIDALSRKLARQEAAIAAFQARQEFSASVRARNEDAVITVVRGARHEALDAEPLPPLTEEEVNALQDYAARHGRSWKRILNNAWMGEAPHDDGGILRRLRNTHGPTWLDRYRLPKR